MPLTTILFDLDDTLFDHTATARAALAVPAEDLYQRYSELLEELHPQVMRGEVSYLAARELRFRRLLAPYEGEVGGAALAALAEEHYAHYRQLRQAVPGALALL